MHILNEHKHETEPKSTHHLDPSVAQVPTEATAIERIADLGYANEKPEAIDDAFRNFISLERARLDADIQALENRFPNVTSDKEELFRNIAEVNRLRGRQEELDNFAKFMENQKKHN